MKRKWLSVLALVLIFCFLTACSSPVAPDPSKATETATTGGTTGTTAESKPADTGKSNANAQTVQGFNDDGSTAKGLNVYDSFDYDVSQDGVSDNITLYTGAKKDQNGNWAFGEGQEWALIAKVGTQSYPFFNRQYVNNGDISYSIYKSDKDKKVHVLVACRQKTGIEINDFVYSDKGNAFNKTSVYSSGTINFIHSK